MLSFERNEEEKRKEEKEKVRREMRLYRRKKNDWDAERKMSDWSANSEMNAGFAAKEHLIDEWEAGLYDPVRWWRAWWWIWSSDRWRA